MEKIRFPAKVVANNRVTIPQNFCKLCSFSTRKVHEAHGESDMERIDGEVVNHLWNMHKTEVSRKVQEQKAIEIASKPGQLRLGV